MADPDRRRAIRHAAAELALVTRPGDVHDAIAALVEPTTGSRAVAIAVPDAAGSATMTVVTSPNAGFPERSRPLPLDEPHPLSDTIVDGRSRLYGSPDELVAEYPTLGERARVSHDASWAHVALRHGDRVIGAIGLGFAEQRTFDAEDEELYREFAHVCLAATERARLYEAEQQARREAERATEIAYALGSAASGAAAGTTPEEVATSVLGVGVPLVGARAGAVAMRVPGGDRFDVVGVGLEVGRVAAPWLTVEAPIPTAATIRDGRARFYGDRASVVAEFPRWEERSPFSAFEAAAFLPMSTAGRRIGAVVFLFDRPRSFDDAERQTMVALASICSQAMGRARRYEYEHEVSITLQQGLLASPVPDVAGVRIATRYVPAFQRLEVGGDWHQVIPLPDGRVGLAVGDVVGKGAEAASTMAQLRSALAAVAISRPEPEDALGVLRRASGVIPGAEAATVAYAVLDPAAGGLRYARAGHPFPLLARDDGSVARLDGGGAPPLLAWDETEIAADEIPVRPGDRLLLYTDGLIERREVSIDAGLVSLEGLVAGAGDLDVESLCDTIVHGCLPGGRPRDDVALLCAEVLEPPS